MHLDDDAENYALGLLPLDERPRIEAHLAECAACRERVVDAERAAWRMSASLPILESAVQRGPATQRWWLAAAAVFALLFAAQTVRLTGAETTIVRTGNALSTIAASHFEHLSLTAPPGSSFTAKVLFAKDRSWIYCIAGTNDRFTVVAQSGGRARVLATTSPTGTVSAAFIANPGPMDSIELHLGPRVMAAAKLP
jgi:anti-sigma factor RsiW